MMLVDLAYSIHLATKLKEVKEAQGLRFEEFKSMLKKKIKKLTNKSDE